MLVWSCSPGAPPKDNSFARPYFVTREGKRLFYTGTGDGSIICANARTGDVLWRYPLSAGGFNASVIAYGDTIIGVDADDRVSVRDDRGVKTSRGERISPQHVAGTCVGADDAAVARSCVEQALALARDEVGPSKGVVLGRGA